METMETCVSQNENGLCDLLEESGMNDTPRVVRLTLDEALTAGKDKASVRKVGYSERMDTLAINFDPRALAVNYISAGMPREKALSVARAVAERTYHVANTGTTDLKSGEKSLSFELPEAWVSLTEEARIHFSRVFDEEGLRQDLMVA